ncbi:MAG: hypothetical protein L0H75_07630 [Nitrosospira sp.]|nr:hypothetical protein [Nitrosospira sp.]
MNFLLPLTLSWILGSVFLFLDGRRRWVAVSAAGGLLAVLILDLRLLLMLPLEGEVFFEVTTGNWPVGIGIRLRVDRLALFFGAICGGILAAVMVHEAYGTRGTRLFPALILLLSTGLHGAFFTGDLFNFYVFFELAVVTSFALAAYGYGRAEIRGTFIYAIVNLLGSVLFLMGVAAVYQSTGTLDLIQLNEKIDAGETKTLILAATLLFVGLSVKLGLFPFHSWVPVLYSHARPAVASAMTGALVNIGAYGLLRIGFSAFDQAREQASVFLIALGAIASVYGAVLAFRRRQPAKIIAYSAVMHAGYIVLCFGIGSASGVSALLLIVLAGSIDKAAMFLSLDAAGPARRLSSLIAASSIAGLPLTAGFFAKVQLFRAALEAPGRIAVILALIFSTAVILVAVFRFWQLIRDADSPPQARGAMALTLAIAIVLLGLVPAPIVNLTWNITAELLKGAK